MVGFTANQLFKIPCEVRPGPFPMEYLITVKTGNTSVSGFVPRDLVELETGESSRGFIRGRVVEVHPDHITVQLPGSFFTTAAGKTDVSSGWARAHLQPAAA